ncbi:probable proline--tRNA ligase, mitochondrial isoform X3 [Ischnura elegans]|uniref:probable proline--tRNA ligase, mitochondrial isoform X3 n=1 Tax=Ischnura elegans TaxID=197161 RepID=UPI001ED896FB|nr:probable proline--tRNA ligase, mitochondrial isoform X3 [Ischnura elegans]
MLNYGLSRAGRWHTAGAELYKLKDRHNKDYLLSPTHEEAIAGLIASISPVSHHKLPIRLYQISSKFRDEKKSRFGMLRGREFLMKDLYTFDQSLSAAENTYAEVCQTYDKIFDVIGVPYVKVAADNGIMGGSLSHEYHFLANIGEDLLMFCDTCNYGANKETFKEETCPSCKGRKMTERNGIEVGHTFVLGSRYSEPLEATFKGIDGKTTPLQMGSYGLGMTRILAAAIETLSPYDEIRWPISLAPYTVCIITPKEGSKEESASQLAYKLYSELNCINSLCGDIIVDDRGSMTIGKRVLEARKSGYPFVIVIGRKSVFADPLFEIINVSKSEQLDLNLKEVLEYFREVSSEGSGTKQKEALSS